MEDLVTAQSNVSLKYDGTIWWHMSSKEQWIKFSTTNTSQTLRDKDFPDRPTSVTLSIENTSSASLTVTVAPITEGASVSPSGAQDIASNACLDFTLTTQTSGTGKESSFSITGPTFTDPRVKVTWSGGGDDER